MTALPFPALMIPLVLQLQPVIGLIMLISQFTMKLTMLPRRQALLVGFVMFFLKPIVSVVVALVQPIVRPIMPAASLVPVLCHRWRRDAKRRDRAGRGKYDFTHVPSSYIGAPPT